MVLIAPVLMGIVLFYWLAFCLTVWAWLRAILNLCECKFIRASLWFNAGAWMLFWWFDLPHDWDTMMPGIVFFTGLGALGTFVRYHRKRKPLLAIPASTPPFEATGNIVPFIRLKPKRDEGVYP
jgi:hypothetical protein